MNLLLSSLSSCTSCKVKQLKKCKKVKFDEYDYDKYCLVCFEKLKGHKGGVTFLPCCHRLGNSCFTEYLNYGNHCCPICRTEIFL
jgi:hypothetical protein